MTNAITPEPFHGEPVVHLGAHLWPVRGRDWEWHARQWTELAETINGRCFIGVAIDETTDTIERVRELLPARFEVFQVPSTPHGEVPTFQFLQQVVPAGPDDVLVYVHAKGVRRDPNDPRNTTAIRLIRLWTEMLYETVAFNRAAYLARLAEGYKCFGAFRTPDNGKLGIKHKWHYSGAFFVVRAKYLGSPVKEFYGGVERWLGMHIPAADGWCELADHCSLAAHYKTCGLYPQRVVEGFEWEVNRIGGVRCEQHLRELDWFAAKLQPNDKVLVIGSHSGGLEPQLRARCEGVRTLSIDINPKPINTERLIVGDSRAEHVRRYAAEAGPWDVVFIDGDHTLAGVTADWEWAQTLRPRLIAFHDIAKAIHHDACGCEVDQLWERIRATHATEEMIVGCGWGGIGVVHQKAMQ